MREVEGEGRHPAECADPAPPDLGVERLAGVLEQREAPRPAEGGETLDRRRVPEEVDREDGAALRRQGALHRLDREVERRRRHVGQDRDRADLDDRPEGRRPGDRRHHHLVTRAEERPARAAPRAGERRDREQVRRGSRVAEDRVGGAVRFCEGRLERGDPRPLRQGAPHQRLERRRDLEVAEGVQVQRQPVPGRRFRVGPAERPNGL